MPDQSLLAYLTLRAGQERERAATCSCPSARAAHLGLAREYERRVEQLAIGPRPVTQAFWGRQ